MMLRVSTVIALCLIALADNVVRPCRAAENPPAAAKTAVDVDHGSKMAAGLKLFRSKVRGVLIENCVSCHGGEETESEFDLTTREGLLRGGEEGEAVEAGDATASRLVQLISHAEEPEMPEDASKLADDEIAAIARWIDLGAPYDKPLLDDGQQRVSWTERQVPPTAREYWAFKPLSEKAPPGIENAVWSRNAIDQFIAAAHQQKGLRPSSAADRRTFVRRAYLDLIGLPPPASEVDAFVDDDGPDAAERLIDRLLATPQYGEKWARHWLDVARFAESHGFEQDYDRPHAYHYRDFVIRALNQDMPYDQFVRWQLAGDELAPEDPLAMMATGFLGAGVFPTQITIREVEPSRYDALDDMAATTGVAFLGLTIGCARCHDHKFDPIPQADYYRFTSTFTTTVRSDVELQLPSAGTEAFEKEHARLVAARDQYEAQQLPAKAEAWLKTVDAKAPAQSVWQVLDFTELHSSGGAKFTRLDDGSLLVSGASAQHDRYTFVARSDEQRISSIRLEALAHPSFVRSGPGRAANGNFALSDFRVTVAPADAPEKKTTVDMVNPRATFEQNNGTLSIAGSIDADLVTGWAVDPKFGQDHAAAFDFAAPVGFAEGTILTITMHFNNNVHHSLGRPRLAISTLPSPPLDAKDDGAVSNAELASRLRKAGSLDRLDPKWQKTIVERFRDRDPQWLQRNRAVQEHAAKRPTGGKMTVMVASEGVKPIRKHMPSGAKDFFSEMYYLKRGDHLQKEGVASQGFLQVLMSAPDGHQQWQEAPPAGWRTSYRRRSLANWITDTRYGAGHLLARVIVNRLWQQHFGRGIVATPNDFGAQGIPPSHPHLLDWLAAELIRQEWRLKPIHKLIMTSATYGQQSRYDAASSGQDPDNIYLWRFQPRRLDGELIRDSILAVSGTLDRTMYGKGTLDERSRRRSVYFMVKRSKLIPTMQLFDAPEPLGSIGRRQTTTVGPQALWFLNNPHMRGYARAWAERIHNGVKPDVAAADFVRAGYKMALGRQPDDDELHKTVQFLDAQADSYEEAGHKAAKFEARVDLCQALLSLSEFVYVY